MVSTPWPSCTARRRESADHETPCAFRASNRRSRPSGRMIQSQPSRIAATKRPSGEGTGALQPVFPKVSCASPSPEAVTEYSCATPVRELVKTTRLGGEAGAGLEPRTTAAASALHMTRGYAYFVTKQSNVCKDRIAEPDPSRLRDLAVDAEVDLRPLPRAAVGLDLAQRVEVADAGLRVLGRDRAARDLLAEQDDGLADLDAAAEPLVLLVRADAADPDQHPEAPLVDALVAAGAAAELLERRLREHRHRAAAAPVDPLPGLLRLHEAHRPAHVRGQ